MLISTIVILYTLLQPWGFMSRSMIMCTWGRQRLSRSIPRCDDSSAEMHRAYLARPLRGRN